LAVEEADFRKVFDKTLQSGSPAIDDLWFWRAFFSPQNFGDLEKKGFFNTHV